MRTPLLLLGAWTGLSGAAGAQNTDGWRPFVRVSVAPGVELAQSTTAGANVGIIWTDDGVVLIDSHAFPSVAEELARDLEQESGNPVRVLVNTHWHIDHVHGNAAIARVAGPDLEIIGHRTLVRDIPDRAPIQLALWPDFFGQGVEGLERQLAGGVSRTNQTLTTGDRAALEHEVTEKQRLAEELYQADLAGPSTTFDEYYTFETGGRTIELYHLGRGHTAGDVIVLDTETGVAFTGDFLVGASRYPLEHAAALERFLELPVSTIVPGHGPPQQGTASAQHLLEQLRTIIATADAGAQAGRSAEAVVAGLPAIEGLFDVEGIARRAYDALTLYEEGTFVSHGVELSYAIDFPEGNGPFPGIVLGHGSGRRVKREQVHLAAQWVARGFAVMRYDKRGVGESGGVYTGIGIANSDTMLALLADDMVAAARELADHPRIRPERIGFYGVSQAGWIIPLALVRAPEVQFGVVLVGPVVSVGLENEYSRLAEGTDTPLEEVYRRFDPSNDPGGFDSQVPLARAQQPLLWLMGGHDRSLPTRTSVENMQKLIEAGQPITMEVFPRGTHGLRDSQTGRILDFWESIDRWLEAEELVVGR